MGEECLQQFLDETTLFENTVLGNLLPTLLHCLQTLLRNYSFRILLYFISGLPWFFCINYLKRDVYVPKNAIPTNKGMYLQTMKYMLWYCALSTLSEYMVKNGWTKSDVSWLPYVVFLFIYLLVEEFGIYQMHNIKPHYKYLHATHHVYNKQNNVSPFARKVASMGTKMKETVKGYLSGFNCQKFAQASDTSRWVKVCLILFLVFTTGPNGVRSDEDIGNPLIPGGRAMDSLLANKTLRGFNLSQRRQLVGAVAAAAINGNINYNDFPRGNSPPNNPGRKRANPYQRPCNSAEYCRQGNKGKKN